MIVNNLSTTAKYKRKGMAYRIIDDVLVPGIVVDVDGNVS